MKDPPRGRLGRQKTVTAASSESAAQPGSRSLKVARFDCDAPMSSVTTNVRLVDSPLHVSASASPIPSLSPSLVRSGAEQPESALQDGLEGPRYPSTQRDRQPHRGHRTRPSGAWLLGSSDADDGDESAASPADRQRQRRLRSYGSQSGPSKLASLAARVPRIHAVSSFVDRNQGASRFYGPLRRPDC